GLRVPAAVGDFMMLDAIRASNGWAMAGREETILPWMRRVASLEGIAICPETAVCFDVLEQLLRAGKIGRDEEILVFNTGAAQKYPEAVKLELPRIDKNRAIDYGAFVQRPRGAARALNEDRQSAFAIGVSRQSQRM